MIIITQDGRGLNSDKIIEYSLHVQKHGSWSIRAGYNLDASTFGRDDGASTFIAQYPTLERAVQEMCRLCESVGVHNPLKGVHVMPPEEESENK